MYKLNENSQNQARVVWEEITREWDCITDVGVEFGIRIMENNNGTEYWTNISEDGSITNWYELEYDSEIYNFIDKILEEGW